MKYAKGWLTGYGCAPCVFDFALGIKGLTAAEACGGKQEQCVALIASTLPVSPSPVGQSKSFH